MVVWHNYYECPKCFEEWEDWWDCQCDDECPRCGNRDVSPYRSIDDDEYYEDKND